MTSNTAGLPDDEDIIIKMVKITNKKCFIFVYCCLFLMSSRGRLCNTDPYFNPARPLYDMTGFQMCPVNIHRFWERIPNGRQSVIKSISRISWSGRASVQSQAMTSCLASSNLTGASPHHPSSDSRHHHNDVMKIIDMYISLYHTGIQDVFNYW